MLPDQLFVASIRPTLSIHLPQAPHLPTSTTAALNIRQIASFALRALAATTAYDGILAGTAAAFRIGEVTGFAFVLRVVDQGRGLLADAGWEEHCCCSCPSSRSS